MYGLNLCYTVVKFCQFMFVMFCLLLLFDFFLHFRLLGYWLQVHVALFLSVLKYPLKQRYTNQNHFILDIYIVYFLSKLSFSYGHYLFYVLRVSSCRWRTSSWRSTFVLYICMYWASIYTHWWRCVVNKCTNFEKRWLCHQKRKSPIVGTCLLLWYSDVVCHFMLC